jgi:hypothetical protein
MANLLVASLDALIKRVRARLRPRTQLKQLCALVRPRTRAKQFGSFIRGFPVQLLATWEAFRERRYFARHGITLDDPWPAARPDAKPRVLFVMNRDLRCDPEYGPSPYFCDCVSSLVSSGSGHARYFFMDCRWHHGTGRDSTNLVALCQRTLPDFIFYLPIQDISYHHVNVSVETLMYLRGRMRIPVLTAIGDAWLFDHERAAQTRLYAECSDRIVVGEPRSPAFRDALISPKLLSLWFSRDAVLFSPGASRDIPISFIGPVEGYANRQAGLAELENLGVSVAHFGPAAGRYVLTFRQIARLYGRSRMTINFTRMNNVSPIRGRVWEALLCGCLLFEEEGSSAEEFFEPGIDYVAFSSVRDLAEKIKHFQGHPQAAEDIARHGLTTARGKYSAQRYWKSVFEAVSVIRQS